MCLLSKALKVIVIIILLVGVMNGVSKKENKQVQNNYRKFNVVKNFNIINSEKEIQNEITKVRDEIIEKETRFERLSQEFLITGYDLSYVSCQKLPSNTGYGLTCTGFSLKGHTWESSRTISVDPNVIELGSQVEIRFNDDFHKKYSGIYVARDTGGAIKGNHIDLFIEDSANTVSQAAMDFGKTTARIMVIK